MNKKILSILVGMLLILAAMNMLFVGCSSAKTTTPPSIPKTSTPTTTHSLKSIAASQYKISLAVNATQQLTIAATYTNGSGKNITVLSIYKSSNDKIATVTNGGLVKGMAVGSASITASYTEGTVTKTVTISVTVK